MNVLIIPEDFRKDQYILEPVFRAMLAQVGRASATVRVCRDPLLGGVVQALNWKRIEEIPNRYKGMVDLFILCVDRDGELNRQHRIRFIENEAMKVLLPRHTFLGENAWQEIEVWALAGQQLPIGWGWSEIRQEVHPKERFFMPLAEQRGLLDEPGAGRKTFGLEAASRYSRIRQLCPEDIASLENRIRDWLSAAK